ncbi:MAG: hypothetical protein LQ340_007311 [Diploschistes diacapsis]|nr:MAG: hypothetical protein LQ340_007311 [Diploschistes diacapsis]
MLIGKLGHQEVLLCACDDGDVVAYYTSVIQAAVDGLETGLNEEEAVKRYMRPLLLRNIGKSAWGLAIHSNARLIAASCNTHDITVFSFALTNNHVLRGESPNLTDASSTAVNYRRRDTEFTLNGHGFNIPNISFLNADSDKEGRYLVSTDLTGLVLIWDLRERRGVKRIDLAGGHHSLYSKTGWSIICVDLQSARQVSSVPELLGCMSQHQVGGSVDISTSRMFLGDSALSSPLNRSRQHRDEEVSNDPRVQRIHEAINSSDTPDHAIMEEVEDLLDEDDGGFSDEAEGMEYDTEGDEVDYEATDDEMSFGYEIRQAVNEPLGTGFEPGNAASAQFSPFIQRLLQWRESGAGSTGRQITPLQTEGHERMPTRRRANSLLEGAPDQPAPEPYGVSAAGQNTLGLSDAPHRGEIRAADFLGPAPAEDIPPESVPDEGFRRAAEHPELRSITQSMRTRQSQEEPSSLRTLIETVENRLSQRHYSRRSVQQQVGAGTVPRNEEAPFDLPFAIFHTGMDFANLYRPPFDKPSIVTCRDPCHQHLPSSFAWLNDFDRLHLTHYVPDLGIIVTATAAGRAAIFSLTRKSVGLGSHHENSGRSRYMRKEELAMRLDWVVPFASQEARDERPQCVLIGIATAPLQGLDQPRQNGEDVGGGLVVTKPKARWRLLLTYEDGTVLSYELWREGRRRGAGNPLEPFGVYLAASA